MPRPAAAAVAPGAAMSAAPALRFGPRLGWHLWLMMDPLQHGEILSVQSC